MSAWAFKLGTGLRNRARYGRDKLCGFEVFFDCTRWNMALFKIIYHTSTFSRCVIIP